MSMKKIIIANALTVTLLAGAGGLGYYFVNETTNYIKTDNAKVDATQYTVTSPATGKLVNWFGKEGKEFEKDGVIGKVKVASPTATDPEHTSLVNIEVPQDSTVALSKGLTNTVVAPGAPLAYTYDLENPWITANIKETDIDNVKVGQEVDVHVDAYKDVKFKGEVTSVGHATASSFSLISQSNGNANYTKVTQVVPVKISIEGVQGYDILPGMNATVRIHK